MFLNKGLRLRSPHLNKCAFFKKVFSESAATGHPDSWRNHEDDKQRLMKKNSNLHTHSNLEKYVLRKSLITFSDCCHSTLESNSHTYNENWTAQASWILFVSYGRVIAVLPAPQRSQLEAMTTPAFKMWTYSIFFPGCIYTDSLTGYGFCLKEKIREVLSWSPTFLSSYSSMLPVFVS